ncbi:hypothetical protein L596_014108 [Steinernema carpocapsae]|uniref:Uncharacterized protein n=1 Tax=Steinernema carpocapsae TaxID=34508 RepID=A0A4U5NAQ0_STECR|nr:hypothetical protein L596_014106 [Steinernema carpocapsae]TKR79966.1 hypothetical protein L596_014108 [Steinernema carpocapsae]
MFLANRISVSRCPLPAYSPNSNFYFLASISPPPCFRSNPRQPESAGIACSNRKSPRSANVALVNSSRGAGIHFRCSKRFGKSCSATVGEELAGKKRLLTSRQAPKIIDSNFERRPTLNLLTATGALLGNRLHILISSKLP